MSFWKALLWTIIFQLSSVPLLLILSSFKYVFGIKNENLDYFLNFAPDLSLITGLIFLWFFFIKKNIDFTIEKNEKLNVSIFLILIFIFFGFYFSEKPFYNFYYDVFNHQKFEYKNWLWKDIFHLFNIADIIRGIIVAPIFEELFFRKFIFSKMLNKYNLWTSIVFSSFCFALIHLPNYRQAIGSIFFGILVCYIFYKTRNIYYSIFFHFIYNFSHYFLKFFGAEFNNFFNTIKYNFTYWCIVVLGITFLIYGLKLINQKNRKQNLKL